jgi:hypothetical protein
LPSIALQTIDLVWGILRQIYRYYSLNSPHFVWLF